jgi:hypothetical protein
MTNFDPIDNADDNELPVIQSVDALFEEALTPTKKNTAIKSLVLTTTYCLSSVLCPNNYIEILPRTVQRIYVIILQRHLGNLGNTCWKASNTSLIMGR